MRQSEKNFILVPEVAEAWRQKKLSVDPFQCPNAKQTNTPLENGGLRLHFYDSVSGETLAELYVEKHQFKLINIEEAVA